MVFAVHAVCSQADCSLNQESSGRMVQRHYVHCVARQAEAPELLALCQFQPHQFLPLSNVDQTLTIGRSTMELGDMGEGASLDVLLPKM